jgi:pSer/pThr/pTyr-binding forkhead associated (FHA) protein
VAVEGNAELIGDSVLLKSGDLVTINGATLKFLNPKQAVMNNFHVIPNFNNSRFSLISLDQDSGHGSFILPTSGKTISVGRDATCNFCINSNRISRVHAQILVFDNQLIVCDQQSRNGTYVNDEKIEKKELHPGDILEFGDNRYLLGYSE